MIAHQEMNAPLLIPDGKNLTWRSVAAVRGEEPTGGNPNSPILVL